jgi:hypothetical protein
MNGRWSLPLRGHFRIMGVDVPLSNRRQRLAFAIIVAGLITVPLMPFLGSPASIWARWIGAGFVALVVVANLILGCFVRRFALSAGKPAADEFESAPSVSRGGQNPSPDSNGDPSRANRGLRLADLMGLIASTAVGIALVTGFLADTHSLPGVDREWGWEQLEGLYASVLVLMALTVGLALSWIGRLRRPLRLASQSPGAIACLVASTVLIAVAYHLAVNYATEQVAMDRQSVFWRIGYWRAIIGLAPTAIGVLILSGWNLVAVGGCWTPEPTWIDRSGRVLGLCWIGWAVIDGVIIPGIYFVIFYRMYGF